MAQQWNLEADAYGTARSSARETRARADAQCRHHRQPIGENEPKRGRRGYDGGKRVKGRKRHLLVDTTGLIAGVLVHEANIQDHDGGKELLWPLKGCLPRLQLIWADSAYKKGGFIEWVKATLGWDVEIVEHPWSGLRGVLAPKDAVIDWEKIRPSGPCQGLRKQGCLPGVGRPGWTTPRPRPRRGTCHRGTRPARRPRRND